MNDELVRIMNDAVLKC